MNLFQQVLYTTKSVMRITSEPIKDVKEIGISVWLL